MRSPALLLRLCLLLPAVAALGCPGDPPGPKIRQVEASDLPTLADPSPTSDPTVEAAGPTGWKRLPRRDELYLIGWYGGSNPGILPRIFVRGIDWTGQAGDTTQENMAELANEIVRSLQDRPNVIEAPQPILLGGQPWVRYVEEAKLVNKKAERQILQRVVAGKLYTVELQIFAGKILESRDQAYAVAAGLKFDPAAAAKSGEPEKSGEPDP